MYPLFLIDAFTDKKFSGNPAAVCILSSWPDESWMQSFAQEMNQSETAFTWKRDDGRFPLRWFTPTVEVDLCGHATLATAHAIWENGLSSDDSEILYFETRSGTLTATRTNNRIELDFPVKAAAPVEPPPGLVEALGARPLFVGRNQFDYILELNSEAELRALTPDFRALSQVNCRGIIVTARSTQSNYDFVSRFFAPQCGINEDPVTGSAHCCLAPYWAEKLGKQVMIGFQASTRGGVVGVRLQADRVILGGSAVTILKATVC